MFTQERLIRMFSDSEILYKNERYHRHYKILPFLRRVSRFSTNSENSAKMADQYTRCPWSMQSITDEFLFLCCRMSHTWTSVITCRSGLWADHPPAQPWPCTFAPRASLRALPHPATAALHWTVIWIWPTRLMPVVTKKYDLVFFLYLSWNLNILYNDEIAKISYKENCWRISRIFVYLIEIKKKL